MLENIPKISVLIVTYNQEELIKRAIDSLLNQKDYIYEICVSDDCSKDKTWDVLQDYSLKYPGLFVLNRNDPNVGIFENIERTWAMPTGDVIYQMAGDDECGKDWFKKVVNFIVDRKIDYKSELFCIYGDYKAIYPNGDSFIQNNKMAVSGISTLKMSLRNLIENRSTCYSINILKNFKSVHQGRSYIAESAQTRQLQTLSNTNYYIPKVGNIYYAQIGVSVSISGERKEQHVGRWDYLLSKLKEWGIHLDQCDLNYIEYRKAKELGEKWHMIALYLKSFDWAIGLKGFQFRRVAFAILRRMPHSKPIIDFKV